MYGTPCRAVKSGTKKIKHFWQKPLDKWENQRGREILLLLNGQSACFDEP